MARPKKYSPIKDIYLAGKIMGYALQLNTEALEKCLLETPDDAFKDELRMTLAYAIRIKNKTPTTIHNPHNSIITNTL